MFRITEGLSSGSHVQCLAKNYKNGSIGWVTWYHVTHLAFRKAVSSYTVNYTHAQRVTICCHDTDLVHVNGHDRIILVILAKHCTRRPDVGSSVIRNMLQHF